MNPFIFYPRENSSSIQEEIQEEMDLENKFFHFPVANHIVFPNQDQHQYRDNQINLLENDFSNGVAMNFLENEEIIGGLSTNINTQNELQIKNFEDQSLSTASSIISSQNETLKTEEEEVKSMHSQKKESKKKHKRKKNQKKSLKRKEPINNSKTFCKCKRSKCKKGFCECLDGGVLCGEQCNCRGCSNFGQENSKKKEVENEFYEEKSSELFSASKKIKL